MNFETGVYHSTVQQGEQRTAVNPPKHSRRRSRAVRAGSSCGGGSIHLHVGVAAIGLYNNPYSPQLNSNTLFEGW